MYLEYLEIAAHALETIVVCTTPDDNSLRYDHILCYNIILLHKPLAIHKIVLVIFATGYAYHLL